jgi:hypothetical protein
MYVQKCIKGVRGIGLAKAEDILLYEGLTCNWIRERDASVPRVEPSIRNRCHTPQWQASA